MTLLFGPGTGLEQLQLAAFKLMQANINAYLDAEEQIGNAIDVEVAAATGVDPVSVVLERFNPAYIHYGHRPSMIEAPVTEYPSMSVMTYQSMPGASNTTIDYGFSLALKLAIEVIVKSGPYREDDRSGEGEGIVGRRIKRTAEAINKLMQDQPALDGQFSPPEMAPTVVLGDIFARVEDGVTATGALWFWQGVRLEYTYQKQMD